MKIQYLAIIFVIIIVPISLIMSAYIQNQIDAIQMQADFDRNLTNATYDAVKGFQINTTNNKYSSISDSKIRDIEAAVNTFYNTLNTAMVQYSYSVDDVKLYIPALLFTLYDGLYISTNYDNVYSTIGEGEDQKVDIKLNGKNYQNGVKPYIYYSAKYRLKNGNIIVVNYTLDNEITVYGDFGDGEGYITRSGYLINPDLVKDIDVNAKTLKYDGVEIGPEALTERLITIEDQERGTTKTDDYVYIFYQNDKIYLDHDDAGNPLRNDDGTLKIFWYNNYQKTYVNDASIRQYATNCGMRSTSAFDYYYEAKDFSEWARDKLGDIELADTLRVEDGITPVGDNVWYTDEQTGEEVPYLSENTGDAKLFYADENNVYLIAETCISYSDIPSNANGNKPYEENIGICADFTSVSADYVGSPDITKQELKDLNSSFYNKNYVNTYDSMKSVAYMMDTDAWKVFAGNKAEYAIGGPSLELFFKSYNKKYGTNYVAEATSEMGYQVGDGSSLGYSLQLSKPNDSLYVDLKYGSSYGYWIASPDAAYGDRGVSCVRGRKCKRNRL